MKKLRLLSIQIASILFYFSSWANASILTFDGFSGLIPDDYGDRITTTVDSVTGYEYGMGNGFTPNITVAYFPDPGAGQPFGRFPSGYGDLVNALGHGQFNVPGEVVLTPDAGFQVILNSFDIAGWASGTYVDSQIRVLNQSGTVLFDSGLIDINSSSPPFHLTFPGAPIVSSEPLRIVINDVGDLGLDNVNFDQAVAPISALVLIDDFSIIKNGNTIFQDAYGNDIPPPDTGGNSQSYKVNGGPLGPESGGKLTLVAANGETVTRPDAGIMTRQGARVNTNINPGQPTLGLRTDDTFSVTGIFDISSPS